LNRCAITANCAGKMAKLHAFKIVFVPPALLY